MMFVARPKPVNKSRIEKNTTCVIGNDPLINFRAFFFSFTSRVRCLIRYSTNRSVNSKLDRSHCVYQEADASCSHWKQQIQRAVYPVQLLRNIIAGVSIFTIRLLPRTNWNSKATFAVSHVSIFSSYSRYFTPVFLLAAIDDATNNIHALDTRLLNTTFPAYMLTTLRFITFLNANERGLKILTQAFQPLIN